VREVCL